MFYFDLVFDLTHSVFFFHLWVKVGDVFQSSNTDVAIGMKGGLQRKARRERHEGSMDYGGTTTKAYALM